MAQLYILRYGKSKKRMHPIMVDTYKKCKNYWDARDSSCNGWHDIVPAENGSTVWKQKTATVGGNKVTTVPRVGKGLAGYVDKHGFHPHT